MNIPEMKTGTRERRYIDPVTAHIEFREANKDEMVIEGIPILYGVRTILWPGFAEVVEPMAATKALEKREAYLLWQHKSSNPMASYKNSTLSHEEREDGVHIVADCSKTTWGRDGYEAVRNKLIDKMSFSFTVADQEWEEVTNPDGSVLTVRHIKEFESIFDFAPVTFPAYNDTEIYTRSYQEFKAETAPEVPEPDAEPVLVPETESYAAEARARRIRLSGIN